MRSDRFAASRSGMKEQSFESVTARLEAEKPVPADLVVVRLGG